MYNGRPAREVNVRERASSLSVDKVKDGVVTRGVLLDIAKLKGKDYLDPARRFSPTTWKPPRKPRESVWKRVTHCACASVGTSVGWRKDLWLAA